MFVSIAAIAFGQATQGVWWMPWGKEPMKDAVTCDKRRGSGNKN